jgi:peptide/nickel transport system substrate-binding protein
MQLKSPLTLKGISLAATTALALLTGVAAEAKTPADTLVIAKNIDDIISFDPAEVYEPTAGEIINNTYDRLFTYKPGDYSKLVGDVVESWTASDDGLTYVFKIRSGLKFQSGNPVTAADVAFSLQRVIALNKTPAFILTQLGWTPENVKDLVVAKDPQTVQLKLSTAFAPSFVLNVLSSSVASVVDQKEALKHENNHDFGYDWLKTHSAGSGPFHIVAWKPKESAVLEVNSTFDRGKPKLKRIIYRHIPESAAQSLQLQKGDIDIARDLSADQIASLGKDSSIKVESASKVNILYLGLNQKYEPLSKPGVRQAIRWLVDYQGLSDNVFKGHWKPHQAVIGSGLAGALDDTPFKLDVAKAKQLLADAGYPNGFDLEIDSPNSSPYTEIAQSIQSTLGQAGIRVKLIQADQKQVYTKVRARGHQTVIGFWSPDYLDPHSTIEWFASNPDNTDKSTHRTSAWRNSWEIPELTKATAEALLERDAEKRQADYIDLQHKLQADSPFVVLFQETEQAATTKSVNGLVLGPSWDTPAFWLVTK